MIVFTLQKKPYKYYFKAVSFFAEVLQTKYQVKFVNASRSKRKICCVENIAQLMIQVKHGLAYDDAITIKLCLDEDGFELGEDYDLSLLNKDHVLMVLIAGQEKWKRGRYIAIQFKTIPLNIKNGISTII